MRKKVIAGIGILGVLLFAGCAGNTPQKKHTPLRDYYHKVVKLDNNKYYYVPGNSQYVPVVKPLDFKWFALSSGLLKCPTGHTYVISRSARDVLLKEDRKYIQKLTYSEQIAYADHPTIIPKHDSKEFKTLQSTFTERTKRGDIACYKPMTNKEVKQYKAKVKQQEKINNDPRVVAARINQQTAFQQQMQQQNIQRTNSLRASTARLNAQTAQLNAQTASYATTPVMVNGGYSNKSNSYMTKDAYGNFVSVSK